jgi:two-component system sensor histidine kinase RegB
LVAAGVLSFAPALPLTSAPMGAARVEHMAELMSVAALSAFSGFFVFVFVQRLQDLRREKEQSEKLAMLGRLVGGMSHELNTPLATILLASRDLALVGKEAGSDEIAQLSTTIADEAQRASDIIGLMRGHVRLGQTDDAIDISAFVVDETDRELGRMGWKGDKHVTTPGPVVMRVLKAGVSQVLKNVLKNAAEATANQVAPRIEVAVQVSQADERVEISVRDNGSGIDPSLLDRLGEPFQTTKEDRGGLGLGLYVSSLLAKRIGGALHVDLPEGGGTRVTLSLARVAEAQAGAPRS